MAKQLLQRNRDYRYNSWEVDQGAFRYFENKKGLASEQGIKGKYVIATSEAALNVLEIVAICKEPSDVKRSFRQLKDVLVMQPIYHRLKARVELHMFVPVLALPVQ